LAATVPGAVCGQTFRVLKEREIKEYREYRTKRRVLEAWDELAQLPISTPSPVVAGESVL
jgi:hypothetical protein